MSQKDTKGAEACFETFDSQSIKCSKGKIKAQTLQLAFYFSVAWALRQLRTTGSLNIGYSRFRMSAAKDLSGFKATRLLIT